MEFKAELKVERVNLKIYINDILHLSFNRSELISVQSWIKGKNKKSYFIEFTMKNGSTYSEYDSYEKWKTILNLIDTEL